MAATEKTIPNKKSQGGRKIAAVPIQSEGWTPFRPPVRFWELNRQPLGALVLISTSRALLVAGIFYLVRALMHQIQAQGQVPGALLLVMMGLSAGLIWLRRKERMTAEKLSQRHINRIRRVVLKRLYRASVRDINQYAIGALSARLGGDLTMLRRWFSLGLSRLISNGILIAASLLLIGLIQPKAAAVVAIALAVAIAASVWLGAHLQDNLKRTRRARIRLAAVLLERLQQMPVIRALGQEKRELKRIDKLGRKLEGEVTQTGGVLGAMRGVGEASAVLLMVAVFIAWQWLGQELSAADVAALFSLVLFLAAPVRELGRVQEYYRGAGLSLSKIRQLMAIPRIVRGRSQQVQRVATPGTIALRGVSYGATLNGFSAQVSPGEKVALIGPNGSGKSTLIQMMLGLIKPDAGSVRLHGVDPLKLESVSRARNTGAFGPDFGLLRTSLRRNIDYRLGDTTDEELQNLVAYCGLNTLVNRLPRGLDSLISDQSANVSSGEQARIALARAINGEPAVLLLDEPESHLDQQGLKLVRHLLKTYPGTIVVSTHQAELVRLCDQTWSMTENRAEVINLDTIRQMGGNK